MGKIIKKARRALGIPRGVPHGFLVSVAVSDRIGLSSGLVYSRRWRVGDTLSSIHDRWEVRVINEEGVETELNGLVSVRTSYLCKQGTADKVTKWLRKNVSKFGRAETPTTKALLGADWGAISPLVRASSASSVVLSIQYLTACSLTNSYVTRRMPRRRAVNIEVMKAFKVLESLMIGIANEADVEAVGSVVPSLEGSTESSYAPSGGGKSWMASDVLGKYIEARMVEDIQESMDKSVFEELVDGPADVTSK